MVKISDLLKEEVHSYFLGLAAKIKLYIEGIDGKQFTLKPWNRDGGGGGVISVIYGNIFEKMGVNVSEVYGFLPNNIAKEMPSMAHDQEFWASGLSLVSHPLNPFVPPIHMNIRCFSSANKIWLGGVFDLNPIYVNAEDTSIFHDKIKTVCDNYDLTYYPKFSAECDEYFTLKHRNEKRGIGGIFFDYLDEDFDKNWEFTKAIGDSFIGIYDIFVKKYINKKWTQEDRDYQLIRRGRYAEFNLLYDRGIKFGLMTNGNIDGMFMSLPPLVKWI